MSNEFDAFYSALEARFRGDFDSIKDRARVYLSDIPRGTGVRALDLGCGRGEWLTLLREEGLNAVGVDMNEKFAADVRELGLNIQIGDVLDYLAEADDTSFDLVSAFHLIEHLRLDGQVKLFSEAFRVLRPNGLFIVEWPNTANMEVLQTGFWLDPTHERPLPLELVSFLATYAGFNSVEARVHQRRVRPTNGDLTGWRAIIARTLLNLLGADSAAAIRDLVEKHGVGQDAAILARKT